MILNIQNIKFINYQKYYLLSNNLFIKFTKKKLIILKVIKIIKKSNKISLN